MDSRWKKFAELLRVFGRGAIVALLTPAIVNSDVRSTTQTLSASLYPLGKVTVSPAMALARSGQPFSAHSGTLPVNYVVRTTPGGGGSITLQAASEFSPYGGPSIAAGALTYTCSGATLGTACSGAQTVSTAAQTPVLTLPAGACTGGGGYCSSADVNSVSIHFAMPNNPSWKTGTYAASVTITISAI